jgi:hypothetical protein
VKEITWYLVPNFREKIIIDWILDSHLNAEFYLIVARQNVRVDDRRCK